MRAIILNLNPSYDHWILLDEPPLLEHVLRGKPVVHQVDGKGLNIGRVLNLLGYENYLCLNILGGEVGKIIEQKCETKGIRTKNFWIRDDSRINTAIVHHYNERKDVQMVNEAGPTLTSDELEQFKVFFKETIQPDDLIIVSGSTPEGFLPSDLTELAEHSIKIGAKLAVDISNDCLSEIVKQDISILKINEDEIRIAFGIDSKDIKKIEEFRKRHNIKLLIITYGKDGAIAITEGEKFKVIPPALEEDFAVGSGDSFFAGLLYKLLSGKDLREALVSATACGAANAVCYGAALFSYQEYKNFLQSVTFKEVEFEKLLGN
ncbi:MAG: ribokinase [Spirochaetia bacterium]|nr:ribokinase [Spirochaetia bacterium]